MKKSWAQSGDSHLGLRMRWPTVLICLACGIFWDAGLWGSPRQNGMVGGSTSRTRVLSWTPQCTPHTQRLRSGRGWLLPSSRQECPLPCTHPLQPQSCTQLSHSELLQEGQPRLVCGLKEVPPHLTLFPTAPPKLKLASLRGLTAKFWGLWWVSGYSLHSQSLWGKHNKMQVFVEWQEDAGKNTFYSNTWLTKSLNPFRHIKGRSNASGNPDVLTDPMLTVLSIQTSANNIWHNLVIQDYLPCRNRLPPPSVLDG